jgi:hypothetical protein
MTNDLLRRGLVFFLCVFSFLTPYAQGKAITGTVTDDKGTPLPGASVSVKNTKIGTSTNQQGVFTISIPANGKTLVISYVGMEPKEVAIGSSSAFHINLTPSANTLSDVVVIGSYTVLLSDLGNPATLTDIWIQEFTGNSSLFYIDDLGLI